MAFNEGKCGGSELGDESQCVELELSSDDDTPTTPEAPQVEPQAEQTDHHNAPMDWADDKSTSSQHTVRRSA